MPTFIGTQNTEKSCAGQAPGNPPWRPRDARRYTARVEAATIAVYRWARHVVRVGLFAGLALLLPMNGRGIRVTEANALRLLKIPAYLGWVLVAVLGMHFLLWKGDSARSFWRRRLAALHLRPTGDD